MALLEVRELSVEIGGVKALDSVTFELEPGEVLGLVGESGSGKSLTALAISRLLPPGATSSGAVRLEGRDLAGLPERALCEVRGRGIGMVFQEPATALNPLLRIGAQVAETVRAHRSVSRAAALAAASTALARVGLDPASIPPGRFPHELSGGQRQRVALALATVLAPRVLIADEPTTALDVATQAQILALLKTLAAREGMAILLISHDLAVVGRFADRLAILEGGRIVESGPTRALLGAPAHEYTRRLRRDFGLGGVTLAPCAAAPVPLLVARDLVRDYPGERSGLLGRRKALRAIDGVGLSLGVGERVGLVGESGSGKSTLVRLLLALEAPTAGSIELGGQPFAAGGRRPTPGQRRLVQAVFQDPFGSLNPRFRVERIVAEPLALLEQPLSPAERSSRVRRALEDVGLAPDALARYPHEFSGGQRQRIALARALVIEPKLLILDEAVSGLDASLRAQILELLAGLNASRGLGYLLVSHDLGVVRATTERLLVMHAGRIVEEGPTTEVLLAPRHPYTQSLIAATPDLDGIVAESSTGAARR